MSSLFQAVFSASLQMTLPLLFILLLIPFLQKRIRANTLFKIEKILFVGLGMALLFSGLGSLIQISMSTPAAFEQQPLDVAAFLSPNIERLSPEIANDSPNVLSLATVFNTNVLGILWFLGMCSFISFTIFRYVLFVHAIYNSCVTVPLNVIALFLQQCRELRIKTPPDIKMSLEVFSPVTIGWVHPTIVLAPQNLSESCENLELLFRHELFHCQQKDNYWRVFTSLILSVYWFHPLVWYLFRSFSLENEMACDEKVLQGEPEKIRKLYAGLLLTPSDKKCATKLPISLQSSLKSSYIVTKLRIEQIALQPRYNGNILLCLCLLGILLFSGIISFEQTNQNIVLQRRAISVFDSPFYISTSILDKSQARRSMSVPQGLENVFLVPVDSRTVLSWKDFYNNGLAYRSTLCFLANEENEEVVACTDGVITLVQTKDTEELVESELELRTFGKCVVLDCGNGLSVYYTFLGSVSAEPGQQVSAGDILGTAGHTGLSYNDTDQCGIFVMQDGVMVDPLPFFEINAPIQEVS